MTDGLLARERHDEETLLAIWEQGLAYAPSVRAEAILRQLHAAESPTTLGVGNRRLIDLHARLFGDEVELVSHCPACNAAVQFGGRCSAWTGVQHDEPLAPTGQLEIGPYAIAFRLPSSADVAWASGTDDDFARTLIDRCILSVTRDGVTVEAADLPDAVLDAVSRRMEALDPLALVTFALDCPECATRWKAPLDIGQLVWTKVQAAAERLLLDVDALARTYGWTERDVLALTPSRRAAYLQLAGA